MDEIKELTKKLPTWEKLAKQIIWTQLGIIENQTVVDFGSGRGVTADFLARKNHVIAIEPSEEMLKNAVKNHPYRQIHGGLDELKNLDNESADVVICHNVLEYAPDSRKEIVREFCRVLRKNGTLSVVKHNRYGRVMQMAVLLNQFKTANDLLDGKNSVASQFGEIFYYEDDDIVKWGKDLQIERTYGVRAFWDLQQNQEIQTDEEWQNKMTELELRVSTMPEFRQIAFFHHIILKKQ